MKHWNGCKGNVTPIIESFDRRKKFHFNNACTLTIRSTESLSRKSRLNA